MIRRRVDAAAADDMRADRSGIEVRKCVYDFARLESPAAAPAADPECCAENFIVNRHALNIHL